jgi:hypothetical protein
MRLLYTGWDGGVACGPAEVIRPTIFTTRLNYRHVGFLFQYQRRIEEASCAVARP